MILLCFACSTSNTDTEDLIKRLDKINKEFIYTDSVLVATRIIEKKIRYQFFEMGYNLGRMNTDGHKQWKVDSLWAMKLIRK